mmetsp:Transcript_127596/g.285431  ORF Transcript_127596/g.285431 Transcript_127596/m.285431 type:complete len:369 (+) Transcript_127596:105-1211(+)
MGTSTTPCLRSRILGSRKGPRQRFCLIVLLIATLVTAAPVLTPAAHVDVDWVSVRKYAWLAARGATALVAAQVVGKFGRDACSSAVKLAEGCSASLDYRTELGEDGAMTITLNDRGAWQGGFRSGDAAVRLYGRDPKDLGWAASAHSSVSSGLADLGVAVSDMGVFVVKLTPRLPEVRGVRLDALLHACNDGVDASLTAYRHLWKGAEVMYRVQSAPGDYDLRHVAHSAKVGRRFGGGSVALEISCGGPDDEDQTPFRCKASCDHRAIDLLSVHCGMQADVSEQGFHGQLKASRDIGQGITASYETEGHAKPWGRRWLRLAHCLGLSNGLGQVRLLQGGGKAPKMQVVCNVGGDWRAELTARKTTTAH